MTFNFHTEEWSSIYNQIYPVADTTMFFSAIAAAFVSHQQAILRGAVILVSTWLLISFAFHLAFYVEGLAAAFWPAAVASLAYFAFCIVTCFTQLPNRRVAGAVHLIGPSLYGWVTTRCIAWPPSEIPRFMIETLPLVLLWSRLYDVRIPKAVA
jgi:hypothetical protein